MQRPRAWELFQLYTWYSLVMEHNLKETPTPARLTLGVLTHESPSVGEIGEHLIESSICTKEYPGLKKDQLKVTYKKKER
jgi:hypothetical protein